MLTPRSISRVLINLGIILLTSSAYGSNDENALFIDGKVRVHGLSMDGARLVVNRDGVQLSLLSGDIGRVEMRLDPGHVYVLSFERTGCMTKELLFDTNLPEEAMELGPFTFPFLVTLEKREPGTDFRYAQPVGYVRYYPEKKDFGYDTDYTLFRERREKEARIRAARNNAVDPAVNSSDKSGMSVEHAIDSAPNDPANGVGPAAATHHAHVPSTTFTRERDTEVMDRTSFMGTSGNERPNTSVPGTPYQVEPSPVAAALPDGRTDELIVEPTYVARVIRITESGHTREYRRVVHRFGDTYYFCNGSSCGEVTYSTAIAESP